MSAVPARNAGRSRVLLFAVPLLIFAALAGLFAYLLFDGRDSGELPSVLIGRAAPAVDLPALDRLRDAGGAAVPGLAAGDWKGERPTLVNIFASWCAPCRAEHPLLMDLAQRGDVRVVGINYKDEPENALRFLNALGNPYERVGVDQAGRAAIDWGFYGIPETFLLDRDGVVRHKIVGPITPGRLEKLQAQITELQAEG